MMGMYFSSLMRFCMKAFGMSTVGKYWYSSASIIHLSWTYLVDNVGKISSSLDINYLCMLMPTIFLDFSVPYILYLIKRWGSRILFLYYSVKYFIYSDMNVSLIWIWFIYKWTANLHLFIHLSRPDLSDRWVMMTAVTSVSFCTNPWLKNTWGSGCGTSCSAIFTEAYT